MGLPDMIDADDYDSLFDYVMGGGDSHRSTRRRPVKCQYCITSHLESLYDEVVVNH